MSRSRIESGELAELAAGGAGRDMRVSPADLPRLAELVVARSGENSDAGLAVEEKFDDGPEGFPRVHLTITGPLALQCQRCLGPVSWQVELETTLTVLRTEEQAGEIEDPFDSVLMDDDGLNIEAIVEDEVLAALPIALVHGPESECENSDVSGDGEAMQPNRPFADLDALMGHAAKNRED